MVSPLLVLAALLHAVLADAVDEPNQKEDDAAAGEDAHEGSGTDLPSGRLARSNQARASLVFIVALSEAILLLPRVPQVVLKSLHPVDIVLIVRVSLVDSASWNGAFGVAASVVSRRHFFDLINYR